MERRAIEKFSQQTHERACGFGTIRPCPSNCSPLPKTWKPALPPSTAAQMPFTSARHASAHAKPRDLKGAAAESLYQAIQNTKIMAPPTNCISPIGEKAILSGLYKQIKGEFYTAVSRPPAVYRGNPFVIEAGLAYGRAPQAEEAARRLLLLESRE